MDKQQLLVYFQDHYLSRQDVLYKLPLNISIDSFWQDLVNQRKARATMLPLYSATGQPYWFVTTDKMVKASERLCEEALQHEAFFDPYRIPLSQALTSALSQEAYFTSYVEGADYPIQEVVDFLRRGGDPENAYEQSVLNNYQAGSYLLSALSIPFDEAFVKELAATLLDGNGEYRSTDAPSIPAMEGENYTVPPAHQLRERMTQYYAFLADTRVHPLIKAAVGQAYILTTRPFPEGNERLGRLISNAVLLRYGYDFFLDISISSYIARESFRYFKAMREIIRSENDGDLTYFVEYLLELLVRALDGAKMEAAERAQSQLEAERKMALQPLKQPTVQFTQPASPHPYSAEAVARAIEAEPDEQEVEEQPAPDPPDIPDGDASFRASQSQAGSTQADHEDAAPSAAEQENQAAPGRKAVKTPLPPGGACPSLVGLTDAQMERLGKVLDANITPFTSNQWSRVNGGGPAECRKECSMLCSLGLFDRRRYENVFYYTFRFSKADYAEACLAVSNARCKTPVSQEQWNAALELLDSSGIDIIQKAVGFVRDSVSKGSTGFFTTDLSRWGSLLESQCNRVIQTLVDRGLVILPARKNMRHTIVVPNETQFPNGELLQADVAHPDSMGPDIPIEEKLVELRESEQPANKRIGLVLTGFLEQGKKRFTIADWISAVGKSKSLAKNDIQAALSLGLVSRDISGTIGNFIVYKVEPILPNFIRWEEISKTNIQVLETIVRSFGTRFFTKQAISEASGIPMANIAYNLKSLRRFSVINMKRDGSTNYLYCLAIPIEEAVRKLHEMGFSPVELVG